MDEQPIEKEVIIEIRTPGGVVLHRWSTKEWQGKPLLPFLNTLEDAIFNAIFRDEVEPKEEMPVEGVPI